MKNKVFIVAFALAFVLTSFLISKRDYVLVSNAAINQYNLSLNHLAPSKTPLQMDCCRPGGSRPSSYGARCAAGQQNCFENDCPGGTSECEDRNGKD